MERRLIGQAKAGDLNAFDQLVERYQSIAFRVAYLTLGDAHAAEDAVQEAFVKAFLNLGRFEFDAPFRPWLLRIVTNEALNNSRTSRRQSQLQLRGGYVTESTPDELLPEDAAIARESREQMIDAMNQLSSKDRALIAQRYLLELSPSEIAVIWELPSSTVRTQISRAMQRLRSLIHEHGSTFLRTAREDGGGS
ncbi:MAG: sigma-70 family RNA polymerase sigma factor [Sphaerobacteraceae bacterium]|nr:MAG: sigma-70 family RNA polymerase sigma factor [Sphaerobacteraceae bacterium]